MKHEFTALGWFGRPVSSGVGAGSSIHGSSNDAHGACTASGLSCVDESGTFAGGMVGQTAPKGPFESGSSISASGVFFEQQDSNIFACRLQQPGTVMDGGPLASDFGPSLQPNVEDVNFQQDDGFSLGSEASSSHGFDWREANHTVPASGRRVPGEKATTLRIHELWSSLWMQSFRIDSQFGFFFRSLAKVSSRSVVQAPTSSGFPMPLPFKEVFCGAPGRSLDVDWNFNIDSSQMKLVNLEVAFLNWFALNQPREAPSYLCGLSRLSMDQKKIVERLCRLSRAWSEFGDVPAGKMGRTAAKQEACEEVLQQLSSFAVDSSRSGAVYRKPRKKAMIGRPRSHVGTVIGKLNSDNVCGALSIDASRIKMAGKPVFDPCPFLNRETRELYERPLDVEISPDECEQAPPRVLVHAPFHEKISLLKLLEKTDRLGFRRVSDVQRGYGNGLFCVAKDLDTDRLILDARPANLLQNPPNKFILSMASSQSLLGLFLEDDQKLLMTGDDLSNFFYTFSVSKQRATKNFLEWLVPTSSVKDFASFPSELSGEPYVVACLCTLAMGDGAACEFAQTSHLAMGLQSGALSRESLLTMHGAIPRGDFFAGIIIDDLIFLEKVAMTSTVGKNAGRCRTAMHSIYHTVGLEPHPSKGFQDEHKGSFWGADVDGIEGLVRANVARAMSLCWVTLQVCKLGVVSINLLESLAGGFVAILSFRRRLLSCLDVIYAVQVGRDRKDIIRMPSQLVDELLSLVALAPLAVTDIRAGFSECLYAVDASNWGDAVIKAHVGKHLGQEMHRHVIKKSVWTRMLSPFKALQREHGILDPELELPEEGFVFTEHPLWQTAAKGLHFELVAKRRAKRPRHINLGELRSFIDAEVDVAKDSGGDVRVPVLSDSQVCLGAVAKGRSSSAGLNRLLRASLPNMIGSGVYSRGAYVRSADNGADDPTRGVPLRKPTIALPSWWNEAYLGNFRELDDMLHDFGLHPHQLDSVPDLSELVQIEPSWIPKSGGSSRQKHKMKIQQKLVARAAHKMQRVEKDDIPSVGFDTLAEPTPECISRQTPWPHEVDEILKIFPADLFLFSDGFSWPPSSPGFLDTYSGKKGFAKAAIKYGASWVLTIDIEDGPHCDLLEDNLQERLFTLLQHGVFNHFSAAPICASFSRAITPLVRTKVYPLGVPGLSSDMRRKLREGDKHLAWVCKMVACCIALGIHYWFENPDSSHMWYQKCVLELPKFAAQRFFRTDFCRYGTAWRKRTRFVCSGLLVDQRILCCRNHVHIILRGRAKGNPKCWTKIAESYPQKLCGLLAWAACANVGVLNSGKNLLASMAKCSGGRIGEASHPGPRRRTQLPRPGNLMAEVHLVRPETVKLGENQWQAFQAWFESICGKEAFLSLWQCPELMSIALARFGNHLYECGKPLYYLRHVVAYAQRMFPTLKGRLSAVWDVITRWEVVEPVEHRRPVPIKLLEGIAAVGCLWKWYRFSGIVLISFFGCCRTGEVLRAKRKHLILPRDLCMSASNDVFLRIVDPKPGRRGLGLVQHAKISGQLVVAFLDSVFGRLDGEALLFNGTPSSFRGRWNKVLAALKIPTTFRLTPGGLRAGGTVELYRQGRTIHDILWALRLRNLETLQHYLQEVSTAVTMHDLPIDAKTTITYASELYIFLLRTVVS